jgi:hypothetical protein
LATQVRRRPRHLTVAVVTIPFVLHIALVWESHPFRRAGLQRLAIVALSLHLLPCQQTKALATAAPVHLILPLLIGTVAVQTILRLCSPAILTTLSTFLRALGRLDRTTPFAPALRALGTLELTPLSAQLRLLTLELTPHRFEVTCL